MEDSIFTKIINKEVPAEILYEDDTAIVILDKFPASPGHSLVIPKRQTKNILENSEQELQHLFTLAQMVGKALLTIDGVEGINVLSNVNEVAGQTVFHTHIHVIPRTGNEKVMAWEVDKYENDEKAHELADILRDKLMAPAIYKDLHPDNPTTVI